MIFVLAISLLALGISMWSMVKIGRELRSVRDLIFIGDSLIIALQTKAVGLREELADARGDLVRTLRSLTRMTSDLAAMTASRNRVENRNG